MKIERNDKMVEMLSASVIGTGKPEDSKLIREFSADVLAEDTSDNRHMFAQFISYSVENALLERTGYFDSIGDFKTIGDNDEALFDVDFDTSFAVIQADGATVPRFEAHRKTVTMGTVEVASRFRVSQYDLRSGKADVGKLTRQATARMEEQMTSKIATVLHAAYNGTTIGTPYYGSASGVVAATLDPMIRYFQRYGSVNLLGDIEIMDKLREAGATSAWTSDEMRNEFYRTGFLGKYKGCNAIQLANGYKPDGSTLVMSNKKLFILPNGQVSPLKIVRKGTVLSMDDNNINDATYEVVLRQRFGAAVVYGNVPMLGVYNDASA